MKYNLILFNKLESAGNTLTLDRTFQNVIVFIMFILVFLELARIMTFVCVMPDVTGIFQYTDIKGNMTVVDEIVFSFQNTLIRDCVNIEAF